MLNFQNREQFNRDRFAMDNDAFNQRRQMGAQMVQGSINFMTQRAADMADKRIDEDTANKQLVAMGEQAVFSDTASRRINYQPEMTAEETDAVRLRFANQQTRNYQRPVRVKRMGGAFGNGMKPY